MLKYLTNAISCALGFTKTESRGTLVLIFIIFIAIMVSHIRINHLKNRNVITADSSAIVWVQKVNASYDLKKPKKEFNKTTYFPIKPAIENAENKTVKKAFTGVDKKAKKKILVRDLNTAKTEELQVVRGIGGAFSQRITKYRELLGGFADTAQLKEVYGLSSETISELLKHFQIESAVARININSDSIKVLANHPYISYDLARIIINYRKLHGDIKSADDLENIKAIDPRTFSRLKPYLE